MDVDAFVAAHNGEWIRLEWLINRGRRLSGMEIDELVELYQRTATHLSVVRSSSPDPVLVGRLSSLVARGRAAVTGASTPMWRDFGRFVTVQFPAAVYRMRWWWLACAALSITTGVVTAIWVARNPQVQGTIQTPYAIRRLVDHDFENYYTDHAAGAFAFQVWVNNVWVSARALIAGPLALVLLIMTSVDQLGEVGGLMFAHGKGGVFFGLILPHGMLELSAVYLACATGLKLTWTAVAPGGRPRLQALGAQGREAGSIALGLIGVLLVSGLIEGFVTGYVDQTFLRIGIGAVAEITFLTYVFTLGRRAVGQGHTGDADLIPDTDLVAAR